MHGRYLLRLSGKMAPTRRVALEAGRMVSWAAAAAGAPVQAGIRR